MRISLLLDEIDRERGKEIAVKLDIQISKIPQCAMWYNKDHEVLGITCRVQHIPKIHEIMTNICSEKELEVM